MNNITGEVRSRRVALRLPLLLAAPVIVLCLVAFVYLAGGRFETTDNAYVEAGLGAVAANVSGPVIVIDVHENQMVRKGDILFRIDPAPFRAAVAEAEAAWADSRSQALALRSNYAQSQAELQAALDARRFAEREAGRQGALLAEGISSQAQFDQARLAAQNAGQAIEAQRQKMASIAAMLNNQLDGSVDDQPAVKKMRAVLDRKRLDLGYTIVRAAQGGIVTKVDQLQPGDYVTAARQVFTLAGKRLWIEANFKESQLDHMRVGQEATIKIDAYPELKLTGRVATFSPGTGNSFAILPPENATGNWVKVVQRLPVELMLDHIPAGVPLHAGLSAEVTVDTHHHRHLF